MGFKISSEFPSRFLSGDEINGAIVPVVIKEVKEETIENRKTNETERALVIYFEGKDRGMKLNKTRANEVKDIVGSDDTDAWKGHKVSLFTIKQKAFGEIYNVLHVKADNGVTKSNNHDELPTIQVDEEAVNYESAEANMKAQEEFDVNDLPL